jgi:hypothetical protein
MTLIQKLINKYNNFILESIEEMAGQGGEYVSEENAKARIEEGCKGCPLYIEKKVLPFAKGMVCDKNQGGCGCIVEVKSKFKINLNLETFKIEKTECPKGIWTFIDHNFI